MNAQIISVLLFIATLVVMIGYAVWRRLLMRRHYYLDPEPYGAPDLERPPVARAPTAGGGLGTLLSNIRMIHVITLVLLAASLWIILSNRYDDDVQKWAFGAMGSILGFWLGPGRD